MVEKNETSELKKTCNIVHPIFEILGNDTRREILRLVACEKNYGNRLANLLNVSTQAIHRHIRLMLDTENPEFPLLTEVGKTKDYASKKGAEAILYNVNREVYLSFAVFPNLIHSHIYEGEIKLDDEKIEEEPPQLEGDPKEVFHKQFERLTELNKQLYAVEREVINLLMVKSKIMEEVDNMLTHIDELEYDERIILRIITCQGTQCIPDLVNLTWKHEAVVIHILKKLVRLGWLPKNAIEGIE